MENEENGEVEYLEGDKEFDVEAPIVGIVRGVVRARNEEEAKDILMNSTFTAEFSQSEDSDERVLHFDVEELEIYRRIVDGNVLYARTNNIEASEIK